MNTRYTIDKLNGENYLVWATQVQLVLEAKGIWGHVDGSTKVEESATPQVKATLEKESRQAMAEIILNIEPRYAVAVIAKKTPEDVWNTLKEINRSQAVATQTTLRRKLLSITKPSTQSVQEFANSIVHIENKLAASGYLLSDFDKKYALLEGLPETYDTIRTILRENGDLSFPQLVSKLEVREEELRNRRKHTKDGKVSDDEVQSKAFTTGGKGRGPNLKCEHCHKKGHKKKDCFFNPESPKYKPHLKKPKSLQNRESDQGSSSQVHIAFMTRAEERVQKNEPRDLISDKWFLDSCATQHMCKYRSFFRSLTKSSESRGIDTAGVGTELLSNYSGTVELVCTVDNKETLVTLKDVAYVPTLRTNLISIPKMQSSGLSVSFPPSSKNVVVSKGTSTIMKGTSLNHNIVELSNVYVKAKDSVHATTTNVRQEKVNLKLLHKRLAHVNCKTIIEMVKQNVVDGLQEAKSQSVNYEICEECQSGKATSTPHTPSSEQVTEIGELIHTDLVGPITPTSFGGSEYILTVLDDASGGSWVAFLRNKFDTAKAFIKILSWIKNRTSKPILRVRSDRGSEYFSEYLQDYFSENGTAHEPTSSYSPESNGKAERLNRTLVERARAIIAELLEINGGDEWEYKKLWAEAVNTANYVRNRVLNKGTTARFGKATPFEIIYGRKPNISNIRIFGSKVHVMKTKKHQRDKFDSKTLRGIHVGYDAGNSYRVFVPSTKELMISRDVTFMEELIRDKTEISIHQEEGNDPTPGPAEGSPPQDLMTGSHNRADDMSDADQTDAIPDQTSDITVRRSSRPKPGPPQRYRDFASLAFLTGISSVGDHEIPDSLEEAMKSPKKEEWISAIENEMESLTSLQVFDVQSTPPGRKLVGCKWVFDLKRNASGDIVRYKARLVARGFSQISGIDYTEVYSPVVRYETFRMLLGVCAFEDYEMEQLDIKTAFIRSELEEEIFMQPPPLPEELRQKYNSTSWSNRSWKLLKALYGLKQGSRAWYKKLDEFLRSIGFRPSQYDPSLFIRDTGGIRTFLLVYVDDILVVAKGFELVNQVKEELKKEFEVRDLNAASHYLGIVITRDRTLKTVTIVISQVRAATMVQGCKARGRPVVVGLQ